MLTHELCRRDTLAATCGAAVLWQCFSSRLFLRKPLGASGPAAVAMARRNCSGAEKKRARKDRKKIEKLKKKLKKEKKERRKEKAKNKRRGRSSSSSSSTSSSSSSAGDQQPANQRRQEWRRSGNTGGPSSSWQGQGSSSWNRGQQNQQGSWGRSSSSWQHGQQRQQDQRGWSSSQNQSWRGSWSGNQSRSSWQPKAKAAEPKAAEPKAAAVPDDSWGDGLPAAKPPAPIPKPAMELPPPPKAPVIIAEPKMPPVKGPQSKQALECQSRSRLLRPPQKRMAFRLLADIACRFFRFIVFYSA